MAPRKKPKLLLDTCFESVKTKLGCYIEHHMKLIELPTQSGLDFDNKVDLFKERTVQGQEEIDDYLQGTLRMRLLHLFLEDSSMMSKTRLGAFILLNSQHITSLAFGHFVQDWYYCLSKLISTCATGITHLSCRWLWLKEKSLEVFIKTIPSMTNLRQLTVPYIATDDLLSAIGRYCNQLEFLDLSGACGLSEEGARSIYRYVVGGEYWKTELCATLKFLYIGGPGGNRLPSGCVSQLLGSYQQGAAALERAEKSKGGPRYNPVFKIQYVHQVDISPQMYDVIIRSCPVLKIMFLDTPSPEWVTSILQNPRIPSNLTKLKMNKVEGEIVAELLKASQGSIKCLELVHCRGSLDLSLVGRYCPYITSLEVYYSERCIGSCLKSLENLHHLNKLVVYYTDISGNLTESLLGICKDLVSVTVQSASTLTIQEFALLSAPLLDYAALVFLMDFLPHVNLIGKLEEWNLSQGEVMLAKSYVKKQNYDLVLWYNLPGYIELHMDAIDI